MLASYDATKDAEKVVHDRFKITSYPHFLFFLDGVPFSYEGSRTIDAMMNWIRQVFHFLSIYKKKKKKTIEAAPPTELRSIDEINEFISANDLAIVYFGNGNIFQDKNFWTFFQVAKMAEEGAYGYTLNDILTKKAGYTSNTLLVYNNLKDTD